jgi:3-isopropylmalate/(R)-2-methylmalate dehydratase large subunit
MTTSAVTAASLPQSLAQKIIARAAGRTGIDSALRVGEVVTCAVDLAMFHDSSGPRRLKPMLAEIGAQIWDKSKVVLVMDHYVPEQDDESRKIVRIARDWAASEALPHVYDSQGICHVVVPQHGHIQPGMLCVGGDSHSPTGGAFGAYMFGIGSTEMLGVVSTGQIWLRVPDTIALDWRGRLAKGVSAKDMMLHLLARFGMNGARYQAVEFCGEAVRALSMEERMTLCNMSAEMGAQTGLIAADETTMNWLQAKSAGTSSFDKLRTNGVVDESLGLSSDAGSYTEHHHFDASTLAPQVAAPHSPANTRAVTDYQGQAIHTAYIGACTGAKIDDLRFAAEVLRGHRIATGTRLLVAPASKQDQAQAASDGTLQALLDAGCELLPNSCGACAGYGSRFNEGEIVISTTARNFKGRMGPASTQVYLASPYTVAASALTGFITDPREVMA